MSGPRTLVQDFVLELEGKLAGRLFSVDGGTIRTQLIDEPVGPHNERIKHTSDVDLQPLVFTCGTGMSHAFYDWIGRAFDRHGRRVSGSVIALDQNSKPKARREFMEALVVELVLPALDSGQKDGAVMKVTVQPEMARAGAAGDKLDLGVYAARLAKNWYVNSFRFKIDDLPSESLHVTHIDSIQLTQGIKKFYTGQSRFPQIEPTKVGFPNISIHVPAIHRAGFDKWHNETMKGNGASQPKKGSIEFLAPGSSASYFGLGLNGVGLLSVDRLDPQTVKVNMYCDSMTFRAGPAAIK